MPAGFVAASRVELGTGGHHLRPIGPDDTDIDMVAVMGSRHRLWSMFGEVWGWPPEGMTAEQDREDLVRHAEEMERNESFNFALLDADETVLLGCVYIDPAEKQGADADISWWVVDELVGGPIEEALDALVPRWIDADWPFERPRYPGRDLSWHDWMALPDV